MHQSSPVERRAHVIPVIPVTSMMYNSWLTRFQHRNTKGIHLFSLRPSSRFIFTLKYQVCHQPRWCKLWCGQKEMHAKGETELVGHTLAIGPWILLVYPFRGGNHLTEVPVCAKVSCHASWSRCQWARQTESDAICLTPKYSHPLWLNRNTLPIR